MVGKIILAVICVSMLCHTGLAVQITLSPVFSNFPFDRPLDLQPMRDGSGRLLIASQAGRLYAMKTVPSPSRTLLLDLTDSITIASSELGLLGVAVHPHYQENGYVYVDYTAPNPLRTVIARYTIWPPSSDSVAAASGVILLQIPQPFENHKGGCLAFGPDGYLYIGMGDGGSAGDPNNNAQNPASLLGKILRINVDSVSGAKKYSIPADNPYRGSTAGAAEEIYATGLRNPWRFSFDVPTQTLWAADVGQDLYEEIDLIEKGKNYGWRIMEGLHCYNPRTGCAEAGLTKPILEYPHTPAGGYCIIGGFVYRGRAIAQLTGKYVYADAYSQHVWALTRDSVGTVHTELLFDAPGLVTAFGVDENNELYLCVWGGAIYRFALLPSGVRDAPEPAGGFDLEQNFPNPFNGETTISFRLAEAAHATLIIYDSIGRMIATLVDGRYAPGSYHVRWVPKGEASGVYTCRMTAGQRSVSRLLVYQK